MKALLSNEFNMLKILQKYHKKLAISKNNFKNVRFYTLYITDIPNA